MEVNKLTTIVVDVDGTMTDGGIYYDQHGNELKKFNTRDAAGFFAAKSVGIKILVVTGRESHATHKRMQDLKVELVFQNIHNKKAFIATYMSENNLVRENMAFIGDDLNDIEVMKDVGFIGCPKDACREILTIAHYTSTLKGGEGAVRDVIMHILDERGQWDAATSEIYGAGR